MSTDGLARAQSEIVLLADTIEELAEANDEAGASLLAYAQGLNKALEIITENVADDEARPEVSAPEALPTPPDASSVVTLLKLPEEESEE